MSSIYTARLLATKANSPLLRRLARSPKSLHNHAAAPFSSAVIPSNIPSAHAAALLRAGSRRATRLQPALRRHISQTPAALSSASTPAPAAETDSAAPETPEAQYEPFTLSPGLPSAPPPTIDWTTSYHGVSASPVSPEVAKILRRPLNADDVEIKPDGIIYLPEIKYRSILFDAFGPGGWGMVPRGPAIVGEKVVTREWALVANGRFISQSQGENTYFSKETIPRAVESCKSNALMRCCKDLGIASELWDKKYIRDFKAKYAEEAWVEHMVSKRKIKIWLRKGDKIEYPYKRTGAVPPTTAPKPAAKSAPAPFA